MKNFKELKESGGFELIDSSAQKTLKGGNGQIEMADCPPELDNPKLAILNALSQFK